MKHLMKTQNRTEKVMLMKTRMVENMVSIHHRQQTKETKKTEKHLWRPPRNRLIVPSMTSSRKRLRRNISACYSASSPPQILERAWYND